MVGRFPTRFDEFPVVPPEYLFDTNAILEAVRTATWNSLTGHLSIATVEECALECRRGDRLSSGYVVVSDGDLLRLANLHKVGDAEVATVLLRPGSSALDPGERDLFAHALHRGRSDTWFICSPDLASIRFAVAIGISDQLISLEQAISMVSARISPPLRQHFSTDWLVRERTKAKLGIR